MKIVQILFERSIGIVRPRVHAFHVVNLKPEIRTGKTGYTNQLTVEILNRSRIVGKIDSPVKGSRLDISAYRV